MWKYAGELRAGDVWAERTKGAGGRRYRVVAAEEGSTVSTVTVTGLCLITGELLTKDFFSVTRVLVTEEPAGLSTVPQ
jgi:hypothetical protein